MRFLVTIEERTRTSDGQGGFTEAWSTVTRAWASLKPVKAYEKFQAQQMETPISHEIVMRYVSGVTTANRITYSDRVFDIKEAINVDEDNQLLQIKAIEKVAA